MKRKPSTVPSAPLISSLVVVLAPLLFGVLLFVYVRMPWPEQESVSPFYARVHTAIGLNLAKHSTLEGAAAEFRHALELDPSYTDASNHLANTLFQNGLTEEAIQTYHATLKLDPNHPDANNNLGLALLLSGKAEESITYFRASLKSNPDSPDVTSNLGAAYMHLGKLDDAESELRAALKFQAGINARHNLALCLTRQGKLAEAVRSYEDALKLSPDHLDSLTELAWILASAAEDSVRDGSKALQLAQKAAAIAQGTQAQVLRSLAAAFAETDDFAQAEAVATQGMQLAADGGHGFLAEQLAKQLEGYRNGKPWREAKPNP